MAFGRVAVARPVHMVFEYDRFRVVHAIDVPLELLRQTPAGVDPLPLTGPTLLSLRPFKDAKESGDATIAALGGVSLSSRPDLWQPYTTAIPDVLKAAKPIANLKTRFPAQAAEIDQVLQGKTRNPESVLYVPMVGRKSFWTVFVDPSAQRTSLPPCHWTRFEAHAFSVASPHKICASSCDFDSTLLRWGSGIPDSTSAGCGQLGGTNRQRRPAQPGRRHGARAQRRA